MKKDEKLLNSLIGSRGSTSKFANVESLQDKTGATAQQIRQAIEIVGFDRDKVEKYLIINRL